MNSEYESINKFSEYNSKIQINVNHKSWNYGTTNNKIVEIF